MRPCHVVPTIRNIFKKPVSDSSKAPWKSHQKQTTKILPPKTSAYKKTKTGHKKSQHQKNT
jgi:hypothetical protein